MLSAIFAYNLLAVYQAQVTPQSGWRQPSTMRAVVFVCGAVLGRIGRKIVLRLTQTRGDLAKHKALIEKACKPPPLWVRHRPPAPDSDTVAPGGCTICPHLTRYQSNAKRGFGLKGIPENSRVSCDYLRWKTTRQHLVRM